MPLFVDGRKKGHQSLESEKKVKVVRSQCMLKENVEDNNYARFDHCCTAALFRTDIKVIRGCKVGQGYHQVTVHASRVCQGQ